MQLLATVIVNDSEFTLLYFAMTWNTSCRIITVLNREKEHVK
jgi:hypothetical protein